MSRSAGKNGLWAALGVAAGGLSTWGYYANLLEATEKSLVHTKQALTAAEDSKRALQEKYDTLFQKTQVLSAARNSPLLLRNQRALTVAENSKQALQVERDTPLETLHTEPSQAALQELRNDLLVANLRVSSLKSMHAQYEKKHSEHLDKIALLEKNFSKSKTLKEEEIKKFQSQRL